MSREEKHEIIFKALADGKRRAILDLLKDGPMTTGDICARFKNLDRCTVMQHLKVLETAELLFVKREGRVRWNYLNAVPIREIYTRWISGFADTAVDVLTKLKNDLEEAVKYKN
jgi:DNA-binding transcriptional ArsR family regulator